MCSEPLEVPAGSTLGASMAAQRDIHSDSATSETPVALDQVMGPTMHASMPLPFHLLGLPLPAFRRSAHGHRGDLPAPLMVKRIATWCCSL